MKHQHKKSELLTQRRGDYFEIEAVKNTLATRYSRASIGSNSWQRRCHFMISFSEEVLMDAILWADEADYLYAQGKYDQAIGFYDRAIEAAPKDADLWNSRGLVHRNTSFKSYKMARI